MNEHTGLVLEGGGARGAFQVGAFQALREAGYSFDGIVGTSIGAINGALIAQGDFDLAQSWWSRVNANLLFDSDDDRLERLLHMEFDSDTISYLASAARSLTEGFAFGFQLRVGKRLAIFIFQGDGVAEAVKSPHHTWPESPFPFQKSSDQ